MAAGIYMINGVLQYTKDLDKKLKRRRNAIIIEEYNGTAIGSELDRELQKLLDKHNNITKSENTSEVEDKPLKYHWINKITNHTIHSIYPTLDNIPNINKEEWVVYDLSPAVGCDNEGNPVYYNNN